MSGHVFNITRVGDGVAAAVVINLHNRVAPYECCIREKRATLVSSRVIAELYIGKNSKMCFNNSHFSVKIDKSLQSTNPFPFDYVIESTEYIPNK